MFTHYIIRYVNIIHIYIYIYISCCIELYSIVLYQQHATLQRLRLEDDRGDLLGLGGLALPRDGSRLLWRRANMVGVNMVLAEYHQIKQWVS